MRENIREKIFYCIMVTVLLVGTSFRAFPAIPSAKPTYLNNSFEFTKSYISSLSWAKQGLSRLRDTKNDDFFSLMVQLKMANSDYAMAIQEIEKYQKSSNRAISVGAKGAYAAYSGVIASHKETLKYFETTLSRGSKKFDEGIYLKKLSDLIVINNKSWSLLLYSSAAVAHALVKMPRKKGVKLSRLNITTAERKKILTRLMKWFGRSIIEGPKAGQHYIVGSAATIYKFLSNPSWKSIYEK